MALSANTLIHFTSSKEALLSILADNFKVHYCREFIKAINTNTVRIPMVSFCDIPLSEIKNHIQSYGEYGIGLTKEWAIKNGLNPVVYISEGSVLSSSILNIFNKIFEDEDSNDELDDAHKSMIMLFSYFKDYQSDLTRKSCTIPNYRFSDEREWRYVPKYNKKFEMFLLDTEDDESIKKSECGLSGVRLEFEPNDIKYIIIREDSEIREFIRHLEDVKGRYSHDDVRRLTTRIMTTQQIKEDI